MQSGSQAAQNTVRSGAGTSSSRRSERVRGALVVTEMALSALLIVGATMLVRSVSNMQHADLGFDAHGLYALHVDLPETRYPTAATKMAFVAELSERLRDLRTLRGITAATDAPQYMSFLLGRLQVEGEPTPPATAMGFVEANSVQPNYFATLGMRMARGTTFTDTTTAGHQVIINEGFARKHWGASSPLGHRLRVAQTDSSQWLTIVGVVHDAQTFGPTVESTAPMLYTPLNGSFNARTPVIMVRTSGTGTPIARVQSLVRGIDAQLTVTVESVEEGTAGTIATPKYVMLTLSLFSVLALVLAAIGLYGVMAYAVAQRTHEIGIRIALGAPLGTVARSVIRRGAVLALIGAGIGLVAAHWGARLIQHQLYGVTQTDPVSLVAAVIVLLGAAFAACVVPTRRAVRVDPIAAIRAE
jgi:putative ABC transport system permease protein